MMNAPAVPQQENKKANLALAALAIGSFTIGTAELLVVGVLNIVSKNLGVSVSTGGLLVTGYALGIAIGGPLLTALTIRLSRRFLLALSLALFIAGNAIAVAAVNFDMLLVARVVTGSIHGLFIGVASAAAASLVPADRRGRAMSIVFGGISVSAVVGVPIGSLIGQSVGWRPAFAVVVALGVIALIATVALVPPVPSGNSGALMSEARAAFAPRVLAMLGVGFIVIGGEFTAFTYLTPFLQHVTGISGPLISAFVLTFGLASAIGTVIGGRLADWNASNTLVIANVLLALSLLLLYLGGSVPAVAVITLIAWGLPGFGLIPGLQLRVISLAGAGGSDLAATLGASAVNAGIAIGAVVGGWMVSAHGDRSVALLAFIICAVAVLPTAATRWLREPPAGAPAETDPAATPVAAPAAETGA